MALDDRDLFNAICNRLSDQPIEVIMEQYEKAKKINADIEKRATETANSKSQEGNPAGADIEANKPKYTRRDFKVKPKEALGEDFIICCICGEKRKSITKTHLAMHGITASDYKHLCGYPESLSLMSKNQLEASRKIISRAQNRRLEMRREGN